MISGRGLERYTDRLAALHREPIVIRGSRGRPALLLAACLVFVALGAVALARGEDGGLSAGLPAALVFGAGAAFAGMQIARPAVMTIDLEGVTVATLVRTWSIRWSEVRSFSVYRMRAATSPNWSGPNWSRPGWSSPEVAAFARIDAAPAGRFPRFGRDAGIDGGFGPGWPLSGRQLTDLLNAARAIALADHPLG